MTLKKCIEQLKDLRSDRESFLDGKYNPELDKGKPEFEDNPFVKDIEAIDTALAAIEETPDTGKRHGTWSNQVLIDDGFGGKRVGYICSACKQFVPNKGNFCLECGADMRGDT